MVSSRGCRICLAILLTCWGLMWLQASGSSAQVPEAAKPTVANSLEESHAAEGNEEQKSAAELAGFKDKVKTLNEAFETKKKELAPRLREAQSRVQQLTAALQKASGPDASKGLKTICTWPRNHWHCWRENSRWPRKRSLWRKGWPWWLRSAPNSVGQQGRRRKRTKTRR